MLRPIFDRFRKWVAREKPRVPREPLPPAPTLLVNTHTPKRRRHFTAREWTKAKGATANDEG